MMSDVDDWMHPRTSFVWRAPPPRNGTYFQIQRKRATPVSGNVSHIYSWDMFEEYADKDIRDRELARLRAAHPTWHLRGRTLHFVNDRPVRGGDPFEYQDD